MKTMGLSEIIMAEKLLASGWSETQVRTEFDMETLEFNKLRPNFVYEKPKQSREYVNREYLIEFRKKLEDIEYEKYSIVELSKILEMQPYRLRNFLYAVDLKPNEELDTYLDKACDYLSNKENRSTLLGRVLGIPDKDAISLRFKLIYEGRIGTDYGKLVAEERAEVISDYESGMTVNELIDKYTRSKLDRVILGACKTELEYPELVKELADHYIIEDKFYSINGDDCYMYCKDNIKYCVEYKLKGYSTRDVARRLFPQLDKYVLTSASAKLTKALREYVKLHRYSLTDEQVYNLTGNATYTNLLENCETYKRRIEKRKCVMKHEAIYIHNRVKHITKFKINMPKELQEILSLMNKYGVNSEGENVLHNDEH